MSRYCPQCRNMYRGDLCDVCLALAQCTECKPLAAPEPIGLGPRDAETLGVSTCPHGVRMLSCTDIWCRSRTRDAPSKAVPWLDFFRKAVPSEGDPILAREAAWRECERVYDDGFVHVRCDSVVVTVRDKDKPKNLLECDQCGGPFFARRRTARFCSPRCRRSASRANLRSVPR